MPPKSSYSDKFLELKTFLDKGLISQQTYNAEQDRLLALWRQKEPESKKNSDPVSPEIKTKTGTVISLLKGDSIITPRNHFKLLECIGGGRYGQVWKVEDHFAMQHKTGQAIKALKFPGNEHFANMSIRKELCRLFEQEANHGLELNHSSIVNVMVLITIPNGLL